MAEGDPEAGLLLYQELARAGMITPEFIADHNNVRLLQAAMPAELLGQIAETALLAVSTMLFEGENLGGWFPDHHSPLTCPRGHSHQLHTFTLDAYEATSFATDTVTDDDGEYVSVGSDRIIGESTSLTDHLTCRTCYASWPINQIEIEWDI